MCLDFSIRFVYYHSIMLILIDVFFSPSSSCACVNLMSMAVLNSQAVQRRRVAKQCAAGLVVQRLPERGICFAVHRRQAY